MSTVQWPKSKLSCSKTSCSQHFFLPISFSYDMRQKEKGRHWKDNRTLGNRAFFHYKETGMRSETGAMQIASFLTIESLRPEDNGFYRCRVDFKEAPTKNTKINLKLIGRPKLFYFLFFSVLYEGFLFFKFKVKKGPQFESAQIGMGYD